MEYQSCVPVEYIDLIIQQGDFNQILYFYDTCTEIRWYLEQPEKLKVLSAKLGSDFETFNDFMVYYIDKMIDILPVTEAIDFTVEFYNDISSFALQNKFSPFNTKTHGTLETNIKLLVNKFRAASLTKNAYRVKRLAKLLYKIQGFISNDNLVYAGPEMITVVNRTLGYNFRRTK